MKVKYKTYVTTQHSPSVGRYNILKKDYATGNTMEGMWNLMKEVRFTQTYKEDTNPFWCSEYWGTHKIPTFLDYPHSYWTKDKILKQTRPAIEVDAYKTYEATGKYNPEDGLWFTSHNSIFDIANKALWVTIREKYEDGHYDFKLK
ncbi:MAG: hypothetical protein KBS95_04350 [Alistipes sp.]|nr:hypothetical protein [Candidatus Alistipes equi]